MLIPTIWSLLAEKFKMTKFDRKFGQKKDLVQNAEFSKSKSFPSKVKKNTQKFKNPQCFAKIGRYYPPKYDPR